MERGWGGGGRGGGEVAEMKRDGGEGFLKIAGGKLNISGDCQKKWKLHQGDLGGVLVKERER